MSLRVVKGGPAELHRPQADWSTVSDGGHGVQFYEDDAVLVSLLASYVGTALVKGESALVVATKPHREALKSCLRRRGLDLNVPQRQLRYRAIDAAEMLSRITRDGRLDEELFVYELENVINEMSVLGQRRPPIAAFGEMVALLWQAGEIDTAIVLEEAWSRRVRARGLRVCCAYPMQAFTSSDHAAPFLRVCAQHTHVFQPNVLAWANSRRSQYTCPRCRSSFPAAERRFS